jgi:hypothetical protein
MTIQNGTMDVLARAGQIAQDGTVGAEQAIRMAVKELGVCKYTHVTACIHYIASTGESVSERMEQAYRSARDGALVTV